MLVEMQGAAQAARSIFQTPRSWQGWGSVVGMKEDLEKT
jgi:hypothetical protein